MPNKLASISILKTRLFAIMAFKSTLSMQNIFAIGTATAL